ncbi:MAG: protein kinase [Gemmataceae bacterium]
MYEDGRLEEILDRWHERFDCGEDLSAAELCRDYPHLCDLVEERLAVLRHLARLGQRFDGDPAKREPITLTEETPWDDATGPTIPATPVPPRRSPRRPMAVPSIPGYQVLEELGRGSMGVVFKAIHLPLKRTVALKVILNDDQATDDQRERFRTEAEAIARLQHPGIVQLFEMGEYDAPSGRRAYMSMEYCNGDTLAKLLAEKPLPPQTAARVVEAIARAVHAAHEAKILHRDLKPGNVLLQQMQKSECRTPQQMQNAECRTPQQMQNAECRMQNERQEEDEVDGDGRATTRVDEAKRTAKTATRDVPEDGGTRGSSHSAFCILHSAFLSKVSDFGLAKKLDEDGQTNTGTVMGTASYMAPEQAEGRRDLGPACDIYALGAILYECLTGRPPFKAATTYETIRQVIGSDPVPPRDLEANCPLDLDTICLKCLHKDPAKRYPTAAALAADLRRFRAGEPIHARPIGALERLARWGRRRPSEAALLAVLALVLLTVPPLMVWSHGRARQAEAEVAALEQTEALARKAAKEAHLAAEASRQAAEASREGELAQQYHSLVHAARQRIAERPPEWPWLALADLRRAAALDTTSRNPIELRTAAVTATAGIDLRERARWTTHLGTGLPAFSPDSKTLGVAQFKTVTHLLGTVGFFDVATGKVLRRFTFSAPSFYHRESQNRLVQETFSTPVFTADGQFAFVGCRSGKVVRFDLRPGGDKPLLWQADTGNLQKLLISGDGKSLYTFSRDLAGDQVIRRWTELLSARPVAAATSSADHVADLVRSDAATLLRRDGRQVDELDATTLQVRKAGQPFPVGVSGAVLAVLGPAEVLATADRGPIKLWDRAAGCLPASVPRGGRRRQHGDRPARTSPVRSAARQR